MKILSIEINNLTSIKGKQLIDFSAEPLDNAGLIAIIGKTGAGKSTILDAICLALYNQIPRLQDSNGKIIDTATGEEIEVKNPYTILRRGCGNGHAQVCFVAGDGKQYTARWEVRRARNKTNGKLQAPDRSLTNDSDNIVISTQKTEVQKEIERLTQLNFAQFTRAVLLAQSEVTAFLKAKDNERGQLLEYLTNSQIFSQIGKLSSEKTAEAKKQLEFIERSTGNIELLSDEDVANLQQQQHDFELHIKQLQQQQIEHNTALTWFDRTHNLQQQKITQQQTLEEQQQLLQAFEPKQRILEQYQRSVEIRPKYVQHHQIMLELHQLHVDIQDKQQQFIGIERDFLQQQQSKNHAEQQWQQREQFIKTHQNALQNIEQCVELRENIATKYRQKKDDYQTTMQEYTKLETELAQQQEQLQSIENKIATLNLQLQHDDNLTGLDEDLKVYIPQLQQVIKDKTAITQTFGGLENLHQQLSQIKSSLLAQGIAPLDTLVDIKNNMAQYQQQIQNHQHELKQFDIAKVMMEQWQKEHLNQQNNQQKIQQLEQNIAQQQPICEALAMQYQNLEQEVEILQNFIEQEKLKFTQNIQELRANLVENEPCLVCGSTQHPYHDPTVLAQQAFIAQEQSLQEKQQQKTALYQQWQNHEDELKQAQIEKQHWHNTQQNTIANIQQITADIQNALQTVSTNIIQKLSHQRDDFDTILVQFKQEFEQCQQQAKTVQEQISQLNQLQDFYLALQRIEQIESPIQPILGYLNDTQHQLWQQQPLELLNIFSQRQTILTQKKQQQQQMEDLNQQGNSNKQLAEKMRHDLAKIEADMQAIEREGTQNTQHAKALIGQIDTQHTSVAQDKFDIKQWLKDWNTTSQQLNHDYHQAQSDFHAINMQYENIKKDVEFLLKQQQQKQQNSDRLQGDIATWLAQHTDFSMALLQELGDMLSSDIETWQQQLQSHKDDILKSKTSIEHIAKSLQEQEQSKPDIEFAQLQQAKEELIANLDKHQQHLDTVKLQLAQQQENVKKIAQHKQALEQAQQQYHRWSKISGLIGKNSGNQFRDIAQQYHLDILLEYANVQLDKLSSRYELQRLDNSLSLAIIDHDMDDEMRSVQSLSGGESFLVALALSLAISEMASGTLKIESLFIDEGFGTLDSDALEQVMTTLDKLQHSGRKVVVISHIQEMQERIPVKILVEPVGAGASQISVVG